MSADNFHAVIRGRDGRYYVCGNGSASCMQDTVDETIRHMLERPHSIHLDRASALIAAHDLEREEWTEYGVWELDE